MSCFETSQFLRNPNTFNMEVLEQVCNKLGFVYHLETTHDRKQLFVKEIEGYYAGSSEYLIRFSENNVTYNSYYLNGGSDIVNRIRSTFDSLSIIYAKESVVKAFESRGFKYLPDYKFTPNDSVKEKFKMVGHTRDINETEKRTEIEFIIHADGSVSSDSNYIPKDLHDLADAAMMDLELSMGVKRIEGTHIKRKPIPPAYKDKAFCKPGTTQIIATTR